MARIPVRARRRVVEQADAAPPARLEGEHAARRGDLEEEVHRAKAAVPGEEAAHHRLGDAAAAPSSGRRSAAHARPGRARVTNHAWG